MQRTIIEFDFAGRRAVKVTDYIYTTYNGVFIPSESTHVHVAQNVVVSENELYNVFVSVYYAEIQTIVFLPIYDMELKEAVSISTMYARNDAMKMFLKKHWNEEYLIYSNNGEVDALGYNIFFEGFEPFTFFA